MNKRELATVLAALRYWQREGLMSGGHEQDIASDGETIKPLEASEIDALCEKFQYDDDPTSPAFMLDALRSLTNGVHGPGIDWAMLDRHRLHLAEIHSSDRISFNPEEQAEEEAVCGILNMLDWLTDAAHDAELFQRTKE